MTPGGATVSESYCDYLDEYEGYLKGWYNEDCEDRSNIPLVPGEGLWIFSDSEANKVVSSGQVPTAPISVYLHKNGGSKLVVNPMPAVVKLADVEVKGYGATYDAWGIYAQRLTPGGATASESYCWCDYLDEYEGYLHGWYNEDCEDRSNEEINPGEALCIFSDSESNYVEFKSPLEKPVED